MKQIFSTTCGKLNKTIQNEQFTSQGEQDYTTMATRTTRITRMNADNASAPFRVVRVIRDPINVSWAAQQLAAVQT